MSDVGMTGDYNSVIGMDKDEPMSRFLRRIPAGEIRAGHRPGDALRRGGRDRRPTGLARRIGAVRLAGRLEEARPAFWH